MYGVLCVVTESPCKKMDFRPSIHAFLIDTFSGQGVLFMSAHVPFQLFQAFEMYIKERWTTLSILQVSSAYKCMTVTEKREGNDWFILKIFMLRKDKLNMTFIIFVNKIYGPSEIMQIPLNIFHWRFLRN